MIPEARQVISDARACYDAPVALSCWTLEMIEGLIVAGEALLSELDLERAVAAHPASQGGFPRPRLIRGGVE